VTGAPVLIVGGGPTGLVLALWLTKLGVSVRIIDKAAEPGTTSRALGVQARTLELYEQIGLAHEVIDAGVKVAGVNLWVRGRCAARVPLVQIGEGMSPYPYLLIYPQDEHERLLIEKLRALNVTVERPVELVRFEQSATGVHATLKLPNGQEETCDARYLAGCDGAHSIVRESLGIDFPGGTYDALFYVADVQATGRMTDEELHVALEESDLLAVFPMKGGSRARLIGTVNAPIGSDQRELTFNDVSERIIDRLRLTIEKVNWFSTYRVHHRVAGKFAQGRAYLLGDAAHIHSPVGAQGMNTGIGDAVNLAWKLAAVLRGASSERLLASYEPERIAFARRLVGTTDRIFTVASKRGAIASRVRTHVVPLLLPLLFRTKAMRRFLFRTVSQLVVAYHESELSAGSAGTVKGGDRLPWVQLGDSKGDDNFAMLKSVSWQLHVYGEPGIGLKDECAARRLPVHVFAWSPNAERAGLARGALYLVRPDGYVALASARNDPSQLRNYFEDRRWLEMGER
jgi:2-polyprenyl-6-methoxyphenol hydroxylase-like FAD-dependent oxidoreductase